VADQASSGAVPALRVFAVDDSKMILNIYRGILHSLGCESKLFEFPAEALQTREVRYTRLYFYRPEYAPHQRH
jgi:DNA-binding NtrC family response regulator